MPVLPNNPWYYSVDEIPYDRSGTWSLDGSRDHVRKYKVVVRYKTMTDLDVLSAPLLPRLGSPWTSPTGNEYDLLARLVKVSADQQEKDDWQVWVVTHTYSTDLGRLSEVPQNVGSPGGRGGDGGSSNNPELEPIDIELDWQEEKRAFPTDLNGKAYLNAAQQPITPAPMRDVAHPVLTISRNELDWSMQKAMYYAYSVNDKKFLGFEPGQVKCLPPRVKLTSKGGLYYWRITYKLIFFGLYDSKDLKNIDKTWQPRFLNQGLCELRDVKVPNLIGGGFVTATMPCPIFRFGHPISQPVCLDDNGKEVRTFTEVGTGKKIINPTYLRFTDFKSRDLSKLFVNGLGQDNGLQGKL